MGHVIASGQRGGELTFDFSYLRPPKPTVENDEFFDAVDAPTFSGHTADTEDIPEALPEGAAPMSSGHAFTSNVRGRTEQRPDQSGQGECR